MTKAAAKATTPAPRTPAPRSPASRRLRVGRSPVHGTGLFASVDLPAELHLLDYAGEIVDWDLAQERWEQAAGSPDHTFFFDLGDGRVIDGGSEGNEARWINHGCEPNVEAVDDDGTIRIVTLRAISAGTELLLDYRLSLDDDAGPDAVAAYACRCGAPSCRRTMLAG